MSLSETSSLKGLDSKYQGKEQDLHLSLLIHSNSIQHAWLDLREKRYIQSGQFTYANHAAFEAALAELSKESTLLKSKSFYYNSSLFTLVPKALFIEEKASEFLSFGQSYDASTHQLAHCDVDSQRAVCLFALPKHSIETLRKYFPGLQLNHQAKTLIESFSNLSIIGEDAVYIQVYENQFDLAIFKGKDLQFFNRFEYQTVEDFIYFLLYALEQLKLDCDTVPVYLAGTIAEKSKLYELMYTYIRKLSFVADSKVFSLSSALKVEPSHIHFDLYNQYLCE